MIDRIHLIGNSPILLGSGLGDEIDSCPVVRINTAPTSGYEEDVGGRTDARVICGGLQKGIVHDQKGIVRDEPWLSTISGETLILYPTKEDTRKNAQRLAGEDNSLRYLRSGALEAWGKFCRESSLEAYPTSGLYGAWFLSNIARQVYLYGFGFYRSSGRAHYWDAPNTLDEDPTPGHDPEAEKTILENMDGVAVQMGIPTK